MTERKFITFITLKDPIFESSKPLNDIPYEE